MVLRTEQNNPPGKILPALMASISIFCKFNHSDKLEIADGQESNVGSYKCQIPGVTQSTDSVNVYFTKKLTVSPSTNPIYRHNTAAQISFTCTYTKAGLWERFLFGSIYSSLNLISALTLNCFH